MDRANQRDKAELLKRLHHGQRILVLPNVWDVASAKVVARAGYAALATSSAAVAALWGYPDGQRISRDKMLEMVARIAHAVDVPVTADMEAGYAASPQELAETARAVIAAGAVGMNLEDTLPGDEQTLLDLPLQLDKIRAIREACAHSVPLVLNARTDVYLNEIGEPAGRFERTVERLNAYHQAGADSLFAPGVQDAHTIGKLVRAVGGPLNILAGPDCPPVGQLQGLGVARVSLGSAVMRATLGLVQRIAQELQEGGTYANFAGAIPFADVQRMLAPQ